LTAAESAAPSLAPVLPVSLLVGSARLLIERHLGLAWISGEISGFTRAASGHCYFMLKDDQAQVRCVLFRQKARSLEVVLRDGVAVEVRATPTIYEARGEFQLNVDTVRLAGLGALYERFARLKARLDAAGWFAPERKRALPAFPLALGIVTSLQAAALRDVLTTLGQRSPALRIIVYPAQVQGAGAAAEIASAIAAANVHGEVDVLIVCRGGGSIEDLWSFNEEAVARAVFESRIPIVSGVGHETDFTICDFVADVRAPTPTAAAALAVPELAALRRQATGVAARWQHAFDRALELRMQRIDLVSRRLIHPAARIESQRAQVAALGERLARAATQAQDARRRDLDTRAAAVSRLLRTPPRAHAQLAARLERWQRAGVERIAANAQRIDACAQSLRHLSPLGVLDRGYSIVTDEAGAIVQDAARLAVGDTLNLRFARGEAGSKVTRTRLG
jgi:exodeoxyribonuclease VII large subunit